MLTSLWINSQIEETCYEKSKAKFMEPSQENVESDVFDTNSHILYNPLASFIRFIIWSATFKSRKKEYEKPKSNY